MILKKLSISLTFLFFIFLIACEGDKTTGDKTLKDCVVFLEILENPDKFSNCPTNATANLCGNIACDIINTDDPVADASITRGECRANDCNTMTCELRDLIGGNVIGKANLKIDQLAGPGEDQLFGGKATLEGSPWTVQYTCGVIVE